MTRWRVTFVDAASERRIHLDVEAEDLNGARQTAWALLRARRPTGLVVVELVDVRQIDDTTRPEGEL